MVARLLMGLASNSTSSATFPEEPSRFDPSDEAWPPRLSNPVEVRHLASGFRVVETARPSLSLVEAQPIGTPYWDTSTLVPG